jgi:hypothetical protein
LLSLACLFRWRRRGLASVQKDQEQAEGSGFIHFPRDLSMGFLSFFRVWVKGRSNGVGRGAGAKGY